MNDEEQQRFEAELRRFPPARLPEQLMARILAAKPCVQSRPEPKSRQLAGLPDWLGVLRWLAPATAAAVILVAVTRHHPSSAPPQNAAEPPPSLTAENTPSAAPMRADDVQLDQKLVDSYDAVAQLPSGEPVRFRVEKWRDQMVLQDTNHGLIVEESRPRFEVVPIRFETY